MPRFGSDVFYRAIVQMSWEAGPSKLMRHAALIHHHRRDTLYRQGNEEEAQEKCSEPLAHVMNLAYSVRSGHTLCPGRQNMKVKLSVSSRSAPIGFVRQRELNRSQCLLRLRSFTFD